MTALYLLNKQQEVFHIVPESDIIELWQNDGINELDTVESTIKLTDKLKKKIDEVYYYAVQNIDDKYTFHLYKAISNQINNRTIELYGLQVGFDELKSNGYIKDYRPQNRPASTVLGTILNGTGWELGFVDSRLPSVTTNFYYLNRLDALSKLIDITGCEVDFKVAITGSRITMKYVDVYYQMGEDTGKRFAYGTNALEIVKEHDEAELFTALVGRGKGEELADDSGDPTGSYGRRIMFTDVEWKKSAGNPVDKPKGQEYVELPEATALYGYPDGKPRIDIRVYEDIEDPEEVLKATFEDLKIASRPKVQFKSTVVNTGNLNKGDTVTIVRHELGIKYQTRVFNVKRNRLNNKLTEISLGDYIVQSTAKKNATFTKNVNNRIENIQNQLHNVEVIAADGTKITYGPDQPATAKVDDLWYEELPNGKVNIRRWNGEEWEIKMFDAFGEEVKNQVTEALDKADEAKQEAIDSYEKSITDAKAYTEQKANEFNGQLEIVKADVADTELKANSAVEKADQAIADAGFAGVDAKEAKANAANALTEAQKAIGNTNTISAGIDSITQALLVKAEKTEVNGLNGRITANTNNILVNATEIRAKLTTAEVNNLINGKSFVTEAKLSATSNSLSASLTEVSKTVGDISFGAKNLILNSKETKYFDYTAPTPDPTISLSPTSKTMNAGDTFTIFATTYPSTENVDWEVSDNAVISVAPDRKSATVIALNTGTSIITASIRGKSRIKTNSYITVNAVGAGSSDEPTLSITPTSRQLEIGQSFTISATTFPSTESVDWESSDTTIISVTNTGKTTTVRAIKNGFAVVTASIRGKSYIKATASVSVNEAIIPDPTISVSPTTRTLEKGQSFTVTATTNPNSESINWLVSDGRVASTSSSTAKTITVTALEAGTVTLTARIASKPYITAASTVTVTSTAIPDPVSPTISVDIPAITLTVGEKFIIKATTNPDSTPIKWVVSTGGVSVSSPSFKTTTITALSAGTIILSATVLDDSTIRASCVITIIEDVVTPPDPSIDPYVTLSQTSKIMVVGESFLFTATTYPASEIVDWTTSNGGVASISGYAKNITAVARSVGSSVITATMRGKTHIKGTAQVTVVAARPMSDPYSFSPISRMVLDADEDVDPIVPYAFRDQEMQTFNLIMPMALGSVVYTLSESLATGTSYIIQAKGNVYGKKVSAYLGNTFIGEMTDGFLKFVLEGYNTSKELSFNSSTTGTRFDEIQLERGTRASDIRPAPEDMATLERAVQIEANLNGLQTTVAAKADKTQITQLSNQISTKVESATYNSKMTQLDSAINLRVQKGDVIGQINVEAGKTLIQNKQIVLDGNTYIMGNTFVNDIKAKSLDAVYADIATLKTKVLTTDVITSTMLKSDAALINKIFVNDANIKVLTSKTAFINSVKAIDISADRITAGTLNASNVSIINLNASAIVANTLSSITANTGALNVSDWLTFSSDNKGIRANYDFGDQLGNSFDPRWFTGSYTLGYRYMKFLADVYTVNGSGGKGDYGYYSESFYGPDYFKLRQYRNSTSNELLTRIDMRAEYISMSTAFNKTNILLNSNGDTFFSGNMQVGGDLWVMNTKALKAYYVQAPDTTNNLYINGGRDDLGSMRFGVDGSALNRGRLISSDSVYKRTYSSAANVVVLDTGTIGRVVSARKYKLNIEKNDLLDTALKTLEISPSSWFDKGEVESIAGCMTKGTEKSLDPNFQLQRHYGFIADEFHDKGATEVVMYDSNGEVEGLAYDRITMYHHELIKDLYRQLDIAKEEIKQLKGAA